MTHREWIAEIENTATRELSSKEVDRMADMAKESEAVMQMYLASAQDTHGSWGLYFMKSLIKAALENAVASLEE